MKSQEFWKDKATEFTRYYTKSKSPFLKWILHKFLNYRSNLLISLIGPTENKVLLDVGCGSGVHIEMIASNCKKIIGVDSSNQVLLEAQKMLSKLVTNNWKVQLSDATNLQFPQKSFDGIICIGLLDYASPNKVLSECCRVLKEKGFIILTIPQKPSPFFFLRGRLGNLVKRLILNLPSVNNVVSRKELNKMLDENGFKPIYIKSIWLSIWIVKAVKN